MEWRRQIHERLVPSTFREQLSGETHRRQWMRAPIRFFPLLPRLSSVANGREKKKKKKTRRRKKHFIIPNGTTEERDAKHMHYSPKRGFSLFIRDDGYDMHFKDELAAAVPTPLFRPIRCIIRGGSNFSHSTWEMNGEEEAAAPSRTTSLSMGPHRTRLSLYIIH